MHWETPLDPLTCPETVEESGEHTLHPGELPVGCAVSARAPAFVSITHGDAAFRASFVLLPGTPHLHSCKSRQLHSLVHQAVLHRCPFFALLLIPYLSGETLTDVFLGFVSPQPSSFSPRFPLSKRCHLVLREFHNMARMCSYYKINHQLEKNDYFSVWKNSKWELGICNRSFWDC